MDLNVGNLLIRDNTTTRFTLERTTGNLTAGGTLSGTQLISTIADGTAPLTVTSTTAVTNLNADLLDGNHASAFMKLTGLNQYSVASELGSYAGQVNTLQLIQSTASRDSFLSFHISNDYAVHFGLDYATNDLFVGGWSMGAVKNKIWHAGNDGSGSGLDADLLDGLNSASTNTASTIVARDALGNFSAGTITATLNGGINAGVITGTSTFDPIYVQMADNDYFRIRTGGTASNAGYVEIATADDGTEPIYVRQYTGAFVTLARTLTLLDESGNTTIPGSTAIAGSVTVGSSATISGNLQVGGTLSGTQLISTIAQGTAPLTITSTTVVSNLNADLLDGNHASAFATASHAHGNIASGGTIASTAITPANTDYILLSDASNSGKIEKGIAIGTATTTYLRNDGAWATPTDTNWYPTAFG